MDVSSLNMHYNLTDKLPKMLQCALHPKGCANLSTFYPMGCAKFCPMGEEKSLQPEAPLGCCKTIASCINVCITIQFGITY